MVLRIFVIETLHSLVSSSECRSNHGWHRCRLRWTWMNSDCMSSRFSPLFSCICDDQAVSEDTRGKILPLVSPPVSYRFYSCNINGINMWVSDKHVDVDRECDDVGFHFGTVQCEILLLFRYWNMLVFQNMKTTPIRVVFVRPVATAPPRSKLLRIAIGRARASIIGVYQHFSLPDS